MRISLVAMTDSVPAQRWAAWWVIAFVALWPLRGIAEVLLSLGSVIALIGLAAQRFRGSETLLSREAWAMTSVLFFSYWLPELFSTFDAVDVARSLREVSVDLRYLPFLWLAAMAVDHARNRRLVWTGIALIIGAWTLDGLLQAVLDYSPVLKLLDLCGFAVNPYMSADRLSGIFGAHDLKLGLVLASMAPFPLAIARERYGAFGWLLAALALGVVILLAGARAAWLTFALVLLVQGWRLFGGRRVFLALAFGIGALLLLAQYGAPGKLEQRFTRSEAVLSGNMAGLDEALAGRVRIWEAAVCMIREHPINGVGVRGYRDAYAGCAPKLAGPPAWGTGGALHAHQIVLEVLSETGAIGLLLWLIGVALAIRAWRWASPAARARAAVPGLALMVTVFPLNTHLAFYSSFWGGLTLLLTALYAGALFARDNAVVDERSAPSRSVERPADVA
jgi:O-antigen ligase